jgi:hypothetical protein
MSWHRHLILFKSGKNVCYPDEVDNKYPGTFAFSFTIENSRFNAVPSSPRINDTIIKSKDVPSHSFDTPSICAGLVLPDLTTRDFVLTASLAWLGDRIKCDFSLNWHGHVDRMAIGVEGWVTRRCRLA